jgi:hypothetical protein
MGGCRERKRQRNSETKITRAHRACPTAHRV